MALAAVVARPADQDTDDLDLVAGVRAGDDRAFELLYLRYQSRIAAYVRSMVHDHGRAEDITQEVFISALRRMRETDREIAFKPWLYEIAKNACIDAYRRSRHANEVSFDAHDALVAGDHDRLAGMGATPDAAVDTKADLDNLRGAFGGLSEIHHQILVMRELEGLSYHDIGERLGMSRPAVESTLFRARRRLGEEYDELVSGKRCLRVHAIVDAGFNSAGVRDRRRMDRHVSHCQPCRRYAIAAGADLGARPPLRPAAAKIAALVPLPAILRRRVDDDAAGQLLASQGHATFAQWSASVAGNLDPGTLVGWSKAIVAAATVAVAGVGAGAAITEREALQDFVSRAPAVAGFGDSNGAAGAGAGEQLREREDVGQPTGAGAIRDGAGGEPRGGVLGLPPGLDGAFGGPGDGTRPTKTTRQPASGSGSAPSTPASPGTPRDSRTQDSNPLAPVEDVVEETLGGGSGAAASGGETAASGSSGPATTVTDVVNAITGAAGSTLSGVKDSATAAVPTDVVSTPTTAVDTALPRR